MTKRGRRLVLFGSRARGDFGPGSDVDVVATVGGRMSERGMEAALRRLEPLCLERGGRLDLFRDDGMDFRAHLDPERVVMVGSAKGGWALCEELDRVGREVSVEEVEGLCAVAVRGG